jgi:glycosyltransferase involved in cell wall biosynthesis
MAKTISVIIPLYAYAQYLAEAIESVLAQTVKPDEIICVSDGAIDNSVEIAKKYPVKIIEKKNGGLASARNAGIREATSEYVMSFDSDDIMRPNCIEEHMKLADKNTIVTCGLMAFGSESYTARPEVASYELLMKRNVIYSNSVFPKNLWEKVGGFDENMKLGLEDWEFWIRCAKAGAKFVTSDEVCLLWRRHPQAMSTASANPNWDSITKYIREKNA